MYNKTSEQFNTLITAPGRTFRARLLVGDEILEGISSIKLSNGSNNGEAITLGSTISQTATITMDNPTISLSGKEFTLQVGLKLDDENIEYIPMGIFTVDKTEVKADKLSITAYDRMIKLSAGYISSLSDTSDTVVVLEEMSKLTGVPICTDGLQAMPMVKPVGYTYREVLMYVSQLYGGFANVNREGMIEIHFWEDSGYVLTADQGINGFSAGESYAVHKITCTTGQDEDGNALILSKGDGIGISFSNPFMTQETLDKIYSKVQDFSYDSVECPVILGDPRIDPWDLLTIQSVAGTEHKVPAMSLEYAYDGGLNMTITSTISSESEESFDYKGPMQQFEERMLTKVAIIETLTAKSITTDNLSAKVADLGFLTAEKADIGYAKIDFSNVGSQVVNSSMIIDGAVTNEKVANLSANKITSGTIDASKINVTNLNADNLTVGTINGQRIGDKSIDLSKLSEEVPTKEYLDSVQENLQGQIDGAIETFTKTEIPTLLNEPASLWTDNDTKKKHIGDICYVVNQTSSADGYCYRFAKLGTEPEPEYAWVLIKDSDVTKTLQDIIDINGEITGIKKFDTEISAWKVSTDEELSSIKSRTATLETDIGNKVETSVFNELKQTVDENSTSITSLSTTVRNKADGSTVTELSNTVNSIKQTVDGNVLSISSMKTDIEGKADDSTVETLSKQVSTIEQDLSTVKLSVSDETTNRQRDIQRLTASLEIKVNKEELISEINASADAITLNSNRLVVNSDNFKLSADGTLEATNGKFSGTITGSYGDFTKGFKVKVLDWMGSPFIMDIAEGSENENSKLEIHYQNRETSELSGLTIQDGEISMYASTNVAIQSDKYVDIYGVFGTTIRTRSFKIANPDTNELGAEFFDDDGNITIGKGLYDNGVGNTEIYGNDVYIYAKNSAGTPDGFRPYFGAETLTISIQTAGYVTSNGKVVCFIVPRCKPIAGTGISVSAASLNGFTLRQDGKYTHGSGSSTYVKPTSYSCVLYAHGFVLVKATFDDTTNAVNNAPIGIAWNGTLTFT